MSTFDNIKKYILKTITIVVACLVMTNALGETMKPEIDLSHAKTLQTGWYLFPPYFYEVDENGIKTLTGLDYELVNLIAKHAKVKLVYQYMEWNDLLKAMEEGKKDTASGVLYTSERAKYLYYSIPYRHSSASLFLPGDKIPGLTHLSNVQLLNYMKQNHFKLGVVKGYAYSDPS